MNTILVWVLVVYVHSNSGYSQLGPYADLPSCLEVGKSISRLAVKAVVGPTPVTECVQVRIPQR